MCRDPGIIILYSWSRGSSVGTERGYGRDSIPGAEARDLSPFLSVQSGSGAYPASYLMGKVKVKLSLCLTN
jgi:hypothetical protein